MTLSTRLPYPPLSSSFLVLTTTTTTAPLNSKMITANKRKMHSNSSSPSVLTCKASSSSSSCSASSSSSWMMEIDLYDLLGVDSSSDHSQIKSAYRTLQKRCHPDIAGPTGHDMAIILNEAYALLSDPISRLLYDKEQSKLSELRGYTGKPIYSVWLGLESEQRAVFVDEVKCVGCLKCALLAEKTFAVESVYGRARVVVQWADSEQKIQEAIDACPVDCISMVERSDLAALEYLMSKQPRGNVRVGAANAVGTRVSNIFVDVVKFQKRFQDAMNKASSAQSTVAPSSQRKARSAAIQIIRSISSWMYWQSPNSSSEANTNLTTISGKGSSSRGNFSKLREAVAARKRVIANRAQIPPLNSMWGDDYWVPSTLGLPQAKWGLYCSEEAAAEDRASTKENSSATTREAIYAQEREQKEAKGKSSFGGIVPVLTAMIAGTIVHIQIEQGGGSSGSSRLEDHIAGTFALGIVNSTWLQVILAGMTWYLISTYVIEVVGAFTSKVELHKK